MAKKTIKRRRATAAESAAMKKARDEETNYLEQNRQHAREILRTQKMGREALALLQRERDRQGLSLADLQERTGMSRAAISRLENNERPNLKLQTLVRLATALGVDLKLQLKRPAKR